jgi:hypothetical protein
MSLIASGTCMVAIIVYVATFPAGLAYYEHPWRLGLLFARMALKVLLSALASIVGRLPMAR